jgi:GAF domain-containing protein
VGDVMAVLDIDSEHLSTFDSIDQEYLEKVCQLVSETIYP